MNVTMNMILSLVSPMITSRLERYFEGDLSKNLSYSSGDVLFEASSLRLRRGTLDELGLPISVRRGYLSSLMIRISITTFKVLIEAHGLFVLVYPSHSSSHFDAEAHKRQEIAMRESVLRGAERRMLWTEWSFLNESPSKAQEWFDYFASHFIRTVRINITDVHIRYQDTSTITGHPFVVGATLKQLIVKNNEEECEENDTIAKAVSFESLSVYLNTDEFETSQSSDDMIWNEEVLSDDELIDKLAEIPSKHYRCSYYDYILSPLSLSFVMFCAADLDRLKADKARIECILNVDRLKVSLTNKQVHTLQMAQASWKYVRAKIKLEEALSKMKLARPKHESDYKLWWQYVAQCIISLQQNTNKQNCSATWTNFAQLKHRYFTLYKRKMRPNSCRNWLPPLSDTEMAELHDLEVNQLASVDQILIFRSLCIAELREQMNKRLSFIEERNKQQSDQINANDSYLITKMLWNAGHYAKSYVVSETEEPSKYKLSQTEYESLIKEIDFAQTIAAMKLPDDYVMYKIHLVFDSISINLYSANHITTSLCIESTLDFKIRPRSNLITCDLNNLDLQSFLSQHTTHIISPAATACDKPIIHIQIETNPSHNTDVRVAVHVSPIQFVWNTLWIKHMRKFFDVSHIIQAIDEDTSYDDSPALSACTDTSHDEQQQTWTKRGQQHLMSALVHRGRYDVSINILHSTLIIPQSNQSSSKVLVAQMDRFTISTVDAASTFEIVSQHRDEYDTILLKQDNCSLIVYQNISQFMSSPSDITIRRLTNDLLNEQLPKLVMSGVLPQLNFTISIPTMHTLFDCANSIMDVGRRDKTPHASPTLRPHELKRRASVLLDDVCQMDEKHQNETNETKHDSLNNIITKFKMKQFSLQLSDDKYDLCKLITHDLCVNVDKNDDDMHYTFSLRSLFIEDLFTNNQSSYLVTSQVNDIDLKNRDLISIDAKTKLNETFIDLNCAFNCLHIEWNPECILAIDSFVDQLKAIKQSKMPSSDIIPEPQPLQLEGDDPITPNARYMIDMNKDKVKIQSEIVLKMEIRLRYIGITLNSNLDKQATNTDNKLPKKGELAPPDAYVSLVGAMAENVTLNIERYANHHIYMMGDLGNLNVCDLRNKTLYKDILCLKDKNNPQIAKFEWWSYDKDRMTSDQFPRKQMYGKKLKFDMNAIRVVFLNPFLSEMMHYMMHSMVYCVLKPSPDDVEQFKTKETLDDLKDAKCGHFRLEINTSNPVLILPRHFESPEHFKLDLGAVSIDNKCEFDANNDLLDIMTIRTARFKLGTYHNGEHIITSNIKTTIHFRRKMNTFCCEPDNIFDVHVPEYNATMRHDQYTLILRLLSDNLTAEPALSPIPYNVDHIKHSDEIQMDGSMEEKPGSSSFTLRVDKASLTLIHDLQKGQTTDICLAKLQLADVIISNLSKRCHDNTFAIQFRSAMIADARNLPNHVFNKILCRAPVPDKNARNKNKNILEFAWNTKENEDKRYKSQDIDVKIFDSCSYCIGSTLCHLYDWFTNTNDPFLDKYPAPKCGTSHAEIAEEDEWDNEFNVNVHLNNSRIILLRDLTKSDCDALVTYGNTTVTIKSMTNLSQRFYTKDTEIKLNDFKLHFAKGNHLIFGKDDRIQVLQPSDFHFKHTYHQHLDTKKERYDQELSLKKITIIGITTQRALALREIITCFITNFNGNAYVNQDSQEVSISDDEKHDLDTNCESNLKVKFERFDVFMHDETVKSTPKIFSFGFHNFNLEGHNQTMAINMLWHANKYYNETWSPLVCPWNCQISIRKAATSIVIEGKQPLDVFVSDIVIRGFIQNATKWINAFKIDTSVPNVTDVQNKIIEFETDDAESTEGKVTMRFRFIVPKFSMYIEQPFENRTLCKIVSSEYSVLYVGDEEKDTVEIKMKYFGIHDFVQESGKTFSMLIESMHSKTAKHVEFLYIYFEHWKVAPIKRAKDTLKLFLDTLRINYNPDTILCLINFAKSIAPNEDQVKIESNLNIQKPDHDPVEKTRKPRIKDRSNTLRLSFDFSQLYINLNKPHLNRQIVEFGLSKTHITFKLYRDLSCNLHGYIRNLTANDLTFEGLYAAKTNNLDCTILGLRDANSKTLLDFRYATNLIDGIHHRYDQEVKVTLSSIKFNYHQLLVMEIVDYINMGILGLIYGQDPPQPPQDKPQELASKQNKAAAGIADDIETKLFYTVSIDKPVIVFPHSRGNENSLDFDLGSIIIRNTFQRYQQNTDVVVVEDINIKANDMQVVGSHNRRLRMVKVSLNVDVRRGVDSVIDLEPNLQVKLDFDRFQITMTQQHYKGILNMLYGNIWAPPTKHNRSTISIGDDHHHMSLSFQTKKAKDIYSKYGKYSSKSALNKVIIQINDLIKNSAQSTALVQDDDDMNDLQTRPPLITSKSVIFSPSERNKKRRLKHIIRQISEDHIEPKHMINDDMNRHIFVDELMDLRVFYEACLFNYSDNMSELDRIMCNLNDEAIQRKTSSIFVHETPLPPPLIPAGKKKRQLSKQQRVRNEYDAIVLHSPSAPQAIKSKSAIEFSFDSVALEYMTMHVLVVMAELKLSLCSVDCEAFCAFSIDGFRTEWNRKHNGDHDTYLTIAAIQLKKCGGAGIYRQMLCPFDHIRQFVGNKEEEKADRPEIIFSYGSSDRTSTTLIVNEPCGFLLPSLVKEVREFFDVASPSYESEVEISYDVNVAAFISRWTSNTSFRLNGGKFICLENVELSNTNAVVLNMTLQMSHGSVAIMDDTKCVIHSDMSLKIDSLSALICPANQIYNVGEHGGVRMHTIIEQDRLECAVSKDESIALSNMSLGDKIVSYCDMEVNGRFDCIDFTISFIDIQIFENIMSSIRHTFSPRNTQSLSQRIPLLIPCEGGLRDSYAVLLRDEYCPELCFEALIKYKNLKLAQRYCRDYSASFELRRRSKSLSLIDLLPSRMYHNFAELSSNPQYKECDIIRALILSGNRMDAASVVLNQSQMIATNYNDESDDELESVDADDEESIQSDHGIIAPHHKIVSKVKINLTAESEKGICINLINDVLSSSAMPFVGIKLFGMHFVWTQDVERSKGTFSFDAFASYYNPMIVAMEPLVESSKMVVNWNSMAPNVYTIKVALVGVKHERSALVPRVIPVNINITHIFGQTLLETMHSWSNINVHRLITSWKPFYIVNKTGLRLYVWSSTNKTEQVIEPQQIEALAVRGGVRAAFTGRLLKYNRLEISFRVGNVASFEQISVFENRRRKIMHKKHRVCVVLHTVFRKGSKFVYIWSPTEIRNHTAAALHIKLYYKQQSVDFGIVEPGASVPVPLSIDSLKSFISFRPAKKGFAFTKLSKIRDLISSQKFTLIVCGKESFILRPRYHRDLITIIIQSPLIVTNLFPFAIRIQLKMGRVIWEERIGSYDSVPFTSHPFSATALLGVWLPGYGQSTEWVSITTNDRIIPININNKLTIYLSNRKCKSVPFFRDDVCCTSAMNMFYLFTSYLFVNKTGLELEIRSPKHVSLCIKQMEVECALFENERRNVHGQWVEPFEPGDVCNFTPRTRASCVLPNAKWKWKSQEWKVTPWQYSRSFGGVFHDAITNNCVRRRKWSRIRIPSKMNMLGTVSCFGGAASKINNKICCRVLDRAHRTDWSQYIPLTEAVTNMVLSIKSLANDDIFFDVAVIFELHRLYPSLCKVIKFYPRFVASNKFYLPLYLKPSYNLALPMLARESTCVDSCGDIALHWFNIAPTRYCCASVDGKHWSKPFPIHEITQFPIRIANPSVGDQFAIIRVESRTIGQTTIVVFGEERRDYPFYQIHNESKYTIHYAQLGERFYPLLSGMAVPFAWDKLSAKCVVVLKIGDQIFGDKLISFENNNYMSQIHICRRDYVYVQVQNRGATKVLMISANLVADDTHSDYYQYDLSIRCDSFGISLCDELPSELLYICGDKLQFNLLMSRNREERIRFTLDSFQIDNQMEQAISPVLFVGLSTISTKKKRRLPWCQFDLNLFKTTNYVQRLAVRPQKFALFLDGASLQKLINFFYIFYNASTSTTTRTTSSVPIYFGELFLAPMELIVSFRDLVWEEEDINTNIPLFADIMFQFGVVVVNFDCAVIRVSGYAERDRVLDSRTLINRLSSHYSGELLRGFFNIIGSLEILGNIAGLTNSVRSGLQDFWFEPQAGTTPAEVFRGFGKGTYSLLQQSIRGLTHSVSSLTSALGTGLAYASGDTDFAKQRSMLKGKQNSKPRNMADGIFKGGKKLASSTWHGISGIWKDPIQGGHEDGVKGAIAGFGQGVMGLVCKPLVGVMDLGSDLVSGIGNTLPEVTSNNRLCNVTQKRLNRMFYGKMNICKEYKYSDALIKHNLKQIQLINNTPNDEEEKVELITNTLSAYSFEGSFETQPNHQHQLFIILGNGLLLCRWSQTKQNKLKFVTFYPWNQFFSISNRPGNKILICTFKLQQQTNHNQERIQQKDLKLPLKSAKFAQLVSRKLQQYVQSQH
eukprot:1030575_1